MTEAFRRLRRRAALSRIAWEYGSSERMAQATARDALRNLQPADWQHLEDIYRRRLGNRRVRIRAWAPVTAASFGGVIILSHLQFFSIISQHVHGSTATPALHNAAMAVLPLLPAAACAISFVFSGYADRWLLRFTPVLVRAPGVHGLRLLVDALNGPTFEPALTALTERVRLFGPDAGEELTRRQQRALSRALLYCVPRCSLHSEARLSAIAVMSMLEAYGGSESIGVLQTVARKGAASVGARVAQRAEAALQAVAERGSGATDPSTLVRAAGSPGEQLLRAHVAGEAGSAPELLQACVPPQSREIQMRLSGSGDGRADD